MHPGILIALPGDQTYLDYVAMEAKSLLKYSEMSRQDISDYLNFTNQSHFAQYFKRLTGYSQKEYREND